ncbi:MAG: hypothetical protein IT463_02220 [Planctomycetes bacterium]|nr:hypothetical protein [Planctomycetota bacterium]
MPDWKLGTWGVVDAAFMREHEAELMGAKQLDISPARFDCSRTLKAALVPALEQMRFSFLSVGPGENASDTNRALAEFSKLPNLRCLSLPWSYLINDSGAGHLAKLHQLQELALESDITDRGLAELGALHQLRVLDLTCSTKFSGSGFAAWPEMPHLRALILSVCTGITDEALCLAAKCPKLDYLVLSGCERLTNSGLAALRGGPALDSIQIYGARLDLPTVRALRANNPRADIDCDLDHLPHPERDEANAILAARQS